MAASLTRLIRTLPLPLFGSAATAASFTLAKSRALPRLLGWALPAGVGALWFVWPAVDDEWKMSMGLKADPEAAIKAAEEKEAKAAAKIAPVELSSEAMEKVESAYKAGEVVESEADKLMAKGAATGDFTYLESQWEEFNEKAIRPGEDDDEDDDDDDDDEDEEDEEEEDDEE
eukprot:scaffold7995_cov91-Skeletonema_dohrnii-CCMP3373.AAC.4